MQLLRPGLCALLLANLSSTSFAFQPLITDDTGTQGQSGKQIEVSFVDGQSTVAGDTTRTRTLPLVYTWGASDTLDLYVGVVPTQVRSSVPGADTGGLGNTALGAKWRVLEDSGGGTSLALKPEIRLPVSTSQEAAGLGVGKTSFGLTLILSQELAFGAIHINLARGRDMFLDPDTRPHANTLRASLAPVWSVSEQWKLTLDLGRESVSTASDTTNTHFMQLGAVYSPNKDIDLALGVLRNADDATPQTTTTTTAIGLTWRFR